VPALKPKTASRRFVAIQDNLAEWLKPYVHRTGKVWPRNLRKLLEADRKAAALTTWPSNALRQGFVSYHLAQFIGTKRDRSDKKESDCGSALSAKSTLQPSIITTRVMATGSNWRAKEDEIRIGIAGARSLNSKAGEGREKGKRDRLESPAGQCPVRSNSAPGALPRKKMLRNFVAFFFSMATYYRNNISGAYLFSSV
jgi:hypothetical protein